MNPFIKSSPWTLLVCGAFICLTLTLTSNSASAQGGGGIDGGLDGFIGGDTGIDGGVDGGGVDAGIDGGGGGGGADGFAGVDPTTLDVAIEDQRNQGFVGATAEGIQTNGFIGPIGQDTIIPIGDNRSIGGGVNDGLGQRDSNESSVLIDENGFSVERRGIRARLRPAFAAPSTPSFVTVSRFQSRIARQPVVRNFGQGVSISVSNRRAVLTGQVRSQAEREIIKRQLRLEPGVYGIDDRTTIAQ